MFCIICFVPPFNEIIVGDSEKTIHFQAVNNSVVYQKTSISCRQNAGNAVGEIVFCKNLSDSRGIRKVYHVKFVFAPGISHLIFVAGDRRPGGYQFSRHAIQRQFQYGNLFPGAFLIMDFPAGSFFAVHMKLIVKQLGLFDFDNVKQVSVTLEGFSCRCFDQVDAGQRFELTCREIIGNIDHVSFLQKNRMHEAMDIDEIVTGIF